MTIKSQTASVSTEANNETFLNKHGLKLTALAFWLLLIGGYIWYYRANDLTTEKALLQIFNLLDSPAGPLIYILIYAVRPLIFFSAAALTVLSGAVFGTGGVLNLVLAILYTTIGGNLSASVAYLIGRFFGKGLIKEDESGGMMQKYAGRMRDNSFETVLIMRFIFLPYDLVNYLAGILRIDWKSFVIATLLGGIPGTIAFVSFGASIDIKELAMGNAPMFDPKVLIFGLVILVVSLAISRYFKKREGA